MKSKRFVAGLAVVAALSLMVSCAPASMAALGDLSLDDFAAQSNISQRVTIGVGGSLEIRLGTNPSAGFDWGEAMISDNTVIEQVGEPENTSTVEGLMGSPGQKIWHFEGLKKGLATISMEYSQPWEGGRKAMWTYTIDVTVR